MLRRAVRILGKAPAKPPPPFSFTPLVAPLDHSSVPFKKLSSTDGAPLTEMVSGPLGKPYLKVKPEALRLLTAHAMRDVSHLLRPAHLAQLRKIVDDAEASDNDKYVALKLLQNANIAAAGVLPGCQDTGTAIIAGYKGEQVFTESDDADDVALSQGVYDAFTQNNLRYSQVAPLGMFDEKNTGTNLPAQIEISSKKGKKYEFLFMTKGGGSANKTFLFQQTKALLNPKSFYTFLEEKLPEIGTSACPPYHLAICVGGTSAEMCLKTVKYASAKFYDSLPTSGSAGGGAFRCLETEAKVLEICQKMGIGAQFGGKYFAHDVRVVRMPRHGASCPVGIGVSCSADRQILGRIDEDGVWIEQLETDPARFLPEVSEDKLLSDAPVKVDLSQPMSEIRKLLSQFPVRTRLSLSGSIIVARDIAHANLRERLQKGQGLPDYFKNHAVYYAGPAKTPEGMPSGSFGPTTAGRMDPFVDLFQENGGSFVMLAKGNRSKAVTAACKKHGGFYLGSIGGPAAELAQNKIKKVEVLDMEELGMEAVWKIDVEDFPAFIVVDDKGNDFFAKWAR